jgi:hypothetical protein
LTEVEVNLNTPTLLVPLWFNSNIEFFSGFKPLPAMTTLGKAPGWNTPPLFKTTKDKDTRTKQQPLTGEIASAETNNASSEPIRQKEDTTLYLPEFTTAEVMVKQEDDSLPAVNHESLKFDDDAIGTAPHHDHTYAFKTLEKGIIYFFYRSRVDVGSAGTCGVHDVARAFIVLRPNPCNEALDQQDGPHRFGDRFRLIVVPKKVLPQTPYVREMGFVEKAGITLEELQESFIVGLNYETQTRGPRTIPDARLDARGVYSITSAQHGSYLNYFLTDPEHIGPVQTDFGLQKRGRWLVQSKNPNVSSPLSVNLPHSPRYPKRYAVDLHDGITTLHPSAVIIH